MLLNEVRSVLDRWPKLGGGGQKQILVGDAVHGLIFNGY